MTEEKSSVESVPAEKAQEGVAASVAMEPSKRARAPKAKTADKKTSDGTVKSENKQETPQAEKTEKETAESLLKEGLEENLKIKRAKGSKNVTTGVADGDLGALANLAALLYEVAATLLGKWRDAKTDYLTVVGGHDAYRRIYDGFLNHLDHVLVPRTYGDGAGIGN